MNGIDAKLLSIEQATDMFLSGTKKNVQNKTNEESFQDILSEKMQVHFSKHANERLESRNITLTKEQLGRLNQGIGRARDKSINESLVMMDNLAFIVNVKNNTVITAMEPDDDSVFTNIDGAVIV